MPYGRVARPCTVFSLGTCRLLCQYGLLGEDRAVAEMRGRVQFWNQLVEIDQDYDKAVNGILEPLFEPYLDLEDKKERGKKLRETRKAAWEDETTGAVLRGLDQARSERAKKTKQDNTLYWTNSDDVYNSYQQARKRPGSLHFHSWARTRGKVMVRWPNGLPVSQIWGQDNFLQIDPVNPIAWDKACGLSRRKRQRYAETKLRLRIGSDGRAPIWLELPIVMDRPLPEGGLLRAASVTREGIGDAWRWDVQLTIETPDAAPPLRGDPGIVGIDLGWRRLPGGIRVAYWADSYGEHGEICLLSDIERGLLQADALQSKRDQRFNLVRTELAEWLRKHSAPDWLKEETATISQWKRKGRLVHLLQTWTEQRFPGDDDIFATLHAWYYGGVYGDASHHGDLAHWRAEANGRDEAVGQRRDQYRKLAKHWACAYGTVVMESMKLSDMARTGDDGAGGDLPPAVRHQRVIGATSVLRLAVRNACRREGARYLEVPAMNTTRTCAWCGYVDKNLDPIELMHECPNCERVTDIDRGAAMVIVQRGRAELADAVS